MESSGNAGPREADKAVLMLRVPVSLKSWLAGHARARGLTINAAAIVLLDQARSKDEDGPGSLSSRPGVLPRLRPPPDLRVQFPDLRGQCLDLGDESVMEGAAGLRFRYLVHAGICSLLATGVWSDSADFSGGQCHARTFPRPAPDLPGGPTT